MDKDAIDVRELHKVFTTRVGFWSRRTKTTVAVESVSFNVHRGELFGLLGPNGAGKTTTVKILSTILLPTAGGASILGMDVVRQTQSVRERIGFTFGGTRRAEWRALGIDRTASTRRNRDRLDLRCRGVHYVPSAGTKEHGLWSFR